MFFAEVHLHETGSAIAFDDPVCSLDHVRRDAVARRLVQEAQRRQVIVFTHDVAFLLALEEAAKDAGVELASDIAELDGWLTAVDARRKLAKKAPVLHLVDHGTATTKPPAAS